MDFELTHSGSLQLSNPGLLVLTGRLTCQTSCISESGSFNMVWRSSFLLLCIKEDNMGRRKRQLERELGVATEGLLVKHRDFLKRTSTFDILWERPFEVIFH